MGCKNPSTIKSKGARLRLDKTDRAGGLGLRLIAEATINEKELNAFIKAYVDYQKIRANYGHALEGHRLAGQERIEQEANTRVKRSLDVQGLSSERYNKIFATVNNLELRQEVLRKLKTKKEVLSHRSFTH